MIARDTPILLGSRGGDSATLADVRAGDDPHTIPAALCQAASIHWRLGHFVQARQLAAQVLHSGAATPGQVDALIVAGSCAAALDDLAAGEELLQRAIDLSRQGGYPAGHSLALQYLASQIQLRRGQFDLALATAAEAARLGGADRQPPAWLLCAWVYQIAGEQRLAHESLAALSSRVPPDRRLTAAAGLVEAQLALDEGDLRRARRLLDAGLAAAEASGHPMLCVGVRIALSRWHRLSGEGAALGWARDAAAVARRLQSRYLEGQALIACGHAAWQVGDLPAAECDLRRALAALDRLGAAYDAAHAALLLGAVYHRVQHAEAEAIWRDVARRIVAGGYRYLLERERDIALPLLTLQLHSPAAEARAAATALIDELMRAPAPALHIAGLGRFEVRQGCRDIPPHAWEQRKAGELFRFLLVQPHCSACRDVIIEALWPGKQEATADRLLQQATWALRHVLEPDLPERFPSRYLTVADHHVFLRLPPGSTVDFTQFEQTVAGAFTASPDALEQALAGYAGALFPCDHYADWSARPREHLAQLYLRGLLYLAAQHLEGRRPRQALDCGDRIAAEDPWSEEATRIAMRACMALGDRPGALRRYAALRRALRRDLRLAPCAELRALAEAIHREDDPGSPD